jgi:hypothetical protein
MNPQWITAIVGGPGRLANSLWALHHHAVGKRMVEMENKVVRHIDDLKLWAEGRFVEDRVCQAPCAELVRRLEVAGS